MKVALFGLGEAGSAIGADLVGAEVEVHAFDPAEVATPPGIQRHTRPDTAVDSASIVLALTAAGDAPTALTQALDAMPAGTLYADFATASAGAKQELAAIAGSAGLRFVDVALMAPVPGRGLRTPVLASGTGASEFVAAFVPLGMPAEFCGEAAGLAATRKLLRSVVIKGFTALLVESMEAAHAAGLADETWGNLVDQFTVADGAFLRRLVEGTAPHALRRLHEMEASAQLLTELGVDPVMTRSTVESLRRIRHGARLPPLPD